MNGRPVDWDADDPRLRRGRAHRVGHALTHTWLAGAVAALAVAALAYGSTYAAVLWVLR